MSSVDPWIRYASSRHSGSSSSRRARSAAASSRTISRNETVALTAAGARYGHEALLGPYAKGWVSHPTYMPGAIIEPLFLTRPTEADIAYSAAGQAVLARAIVMAVQQFLGA